MARRLKQFSPAACQPRLSRPEQKRLGAFYTPPEIVRLILELVLRPQCGAKASPPRILDPACGAGEFLLEAYHRLAAATGHATARQAIFGIDIDPAAVATARSRLQAIDNLFPARHIACSSALTDDPFAFGAFDAIVGNPPYINIRELAKSRSEGEIAALRRRFPTARGNFDLYVLFIERAIELLRPGGRCGLIVPNKWATLDYARPLRELLLERTAIEHVIDFSDSRAFAGANIYPHVLVFRNEPAGKKHFIHVRPYDKHDGYKVRQDRLSPAAIQLVATLDVEARSTTVPLGEIARLSCGTAGYTASRIAPRLVDAGESRADNNTADFITSGNIDRYTIRLGSVRYLKRDYLRPRLPLEIPELTAAKRRLFAASKIVIAGMSRRLEAAWDGRGLALGVQVFAASQFRVDPHYLLALLNSKLLAYLFATRFAAKRLGGGYLAINKGQLAQLPVCVASRADQKERRMQDRLSQLAANWRPAADAEIDSIVYRLYRLSTAEISRVEYHFTDTSAIRSETRKAA
jgi:SAM-dependent methyltransferase